MNFVIFSDMDGTLLDDKYSFEEAYKALSKLKSLKIPLVLSSSKTRSEIEAYRKRLNNKDPFVVEDGGAIFIPKNYFSLDFESSFITEKYKVIEIGEKYTKLRKFLTDLKKDFPEIKGFGDMTIKELVQDSGLSTEHAKLAKQRGYDEAFRANKSDWKEIKKRIKKAGFNYTEGGKYYHILGDSDKGKAVEILSNLYSKEFGEITSVSLGDSSNDIPMFKKTKLHFKVKGPKDWNKKILELFE